MAACKVLKLQSWFYLAFDHSNIILVLAKYSICNATHGNQAILFAQLVQTDLHT